MNAKTTSGIVAICSLHRNRKCSSRTNSIRCRTFDAIDDDKLDRFSGRFQFEPELLLERGEETVAGVGARVGILLREPQLEVEAARQTRSVHHLTADELHDH